MPRFELCRFDAHRSGISRVREAVFVAEQGVPLELEWDGLDASATHAVALDEAGEVIATARIVFAVEGDNPSAERQAAHIGRMAVLPPWRRQGIASHLLELLCARARRQGVGQVCLNAQVSAVPFYRKHGFVIEGDVFEDAGIPHQHMCRVLKLPG